MMDSPTSLSLVIDTESLTMDDRWWVASDGLRWPDFTLTIKVKSKPTTNHPWKSSSLAEFKLNQFSQATKPTMTNLTKMNHQKHQNTSNNTIYKKTSSSYVHMLILKQRVSDVSCVDGWNKVPMNTRESFTHCANMSLTFSHLLWLRNARFYCLNCSSRLCSCASWRSKTGFAKIFFSA